MVCLIIFILILGLFEIVSNIFHVSKGSIEKIGQSAKKQHQELPLDIKDIHFFIKAIVMLMFGILFILVGILYLFHVDPDFVFGKGLFLLFGIYGVIQAVIYRRPINVWLSMIVYIIPIVLYYVINN